MIIVMAVKINQSIHPFIHTSIHQWLHVFMCDLKPHTQIKYKKYTSLGGPAALNTLLVSTTIFSL